MKNLILISLAFYLFACTNPETKEATIDTPFFEVIATKHNNVVQNFYLFVKDTSEQKLIDIYAIFKKDNCTMQCNINMYNTKEGFNLDMEVLEGGANLKKGNLL